nr:hypothetical protein B0A51_17942 [Rachicladosporium sp. CCFEE 5018]
MPSETRREKRDEPQPGPALPQARPMARERSTNGTLDAWVEPTMPSAKPSFEDHGGSAYGVLEHMQPLGEAPSARVRARVKADGGRKGMLGRSAAGAGSGFQGTPESTPGPVAPPSPVKAELEPPMPAIIVDDENDMDYTEKKSKKKEKVAKTRVTKPKTEAPAASSSAAVRKPKKVVNKNRVYSAEKLRAVVDEAKARAVKAGKPDLVAAVEEIHRMSLTDAHLTGLLEVVLLQKATPKQTAEFSDYVKKAKRTLRQQAQQKDTPREQPRLENGTKSLPVRSPVKVEPQENNIAPTVAPPAVPTTERTEVVIKSKPSIKLNAGRRSDEPRRESNSRMATMTSIPRTEDEAALSDDSELTDLSEVEDGIDAKAESLTVPARTTGRLSSDATPTNHALRVGAQNGSLKRSSAEADLEDSSTERELAAKKQRLSGRVQREYQYEESNVRTSSGLRNEVRTSSRQDALVPPKITLRPNGLEPASARGSRAVSTDLDSPLSSPALSSRRGTPHVWKGPARTTGKRAKTKTSPEKKAPVANTGLLSNGGAGRDSPIGIDDNEEQSENNDFCSSCGGSGFLLCCDGCDRSFHFTCLDPPLNEDASELNEPWFCFDCVAKRPTTIEQPERAANGLFGPLLNSLYKRNPVTFTLPAELKVEFVSVSEGKRGEFVEVRPKARNRAGYDDRPDDLKQKDSKGNPVLCYYCGKSSAGKRPIIQCDHCTQSWHLDCLDPPLANPPCRDALGGKSGDWMCPLHVDHVLRNIEVARVVPRRTMNVRRATKLKPMQTALRRGQLNTGVIEIADEESDEDEDEFDEEDAYGQGVIYKMPTAGIKLDFIEKIKQTRAFPTDDERPAKQRRLEETYPPSQLGQSSFSSRSIRDQQTALLLAQMASTDQDIGLGADKVENLVSALITEAPEAVLDHVTTTETDLGAADVNGGEMPPSPPGSDGIELITPEQREDLLKLQELIARKLAGGKP